MPTASDAALNRAAICGRCWAAALLACAMGFAASCSSSPSASSAPIRVTIAELVAYQSAYVNKTVATSPGVVTRFSDSGGTYFVLQADAQDRVALRPSAKVAGYVGRSVRVTGRFGFDPNAGRYIEVSSITTEAPAASPT